MAEILTISRKTPDSPAKDFAYLKEQGIRYIQLVAGNNWTDYNSHDPGITMLEQFAYAINDLANRTAFDIKDLLAEKNGDAGKQTHFFTPRQILTTRPVSLDDFRKIIIDTPGIKNAWLEPRVESGFYSDGPVVYHDDKKEVLSYLANADTSPVSFVGLYDVLLEFDYHTDFGHLNSNSVSLPVEITNAASALSGFKAVMAAQFAYWDSDLFPDTDISHLPAAQQTEFIHRIVLDTLEDIDITLYHGYDQLRIKISQDADFSPGSDGIEVRDAMSRERYPDLEEELRQAFSNSLNDLALKYYQKVMHIRSIVKKVSDRIHQNRNLSEDFISIKSLKVKEIALCIKVDLQHDALPDRVLADIYHAVELFLAPSLQWSTLEELLNRRVAVDEIFEGPPLEHGFLTDTQMSISDRRKTIYISDLINVISDIKGVEFLGEIEIGLKEGKEFKVKAGKGQWHLTLDDEDQQGIYCIPRLNIDHSNIRFYKSRIPLSTNRDEVNKLLSNLRAGVQAQTQSELDLSVPVGQIKEVGDYASIQSDLPTTYGVGELGLTSAAEDIRKAQANQLKAYLVIFEQLLSNYLAQLKNLNCLFSLDTSIEHTYFVKDLYDVPNVGGLLKDFIENGGFSTDPTEDDPAVFKNKWVDFMADVENGYLSHLQSITEGNQVNEYGEEESIFLDRRNRFLDHLMARFGEQIDEYANILHSIDSDISGYQLIEDKALLLQDYPKISAHRGGGFNYWSSQNWPDQQYSGLERRIARLLGIDLFNMSGPGASFEAYTTDSGRHRFRIVDQSGEIILNAVTGYENELILNDVRRYVLDSGLRKKNYEKRTSRSGKFYFNLLNDQGKRIARSQEYHDREEQRLQEIMMLIDQLRKTDEKLHVVEHILLRPRIAGRDKLLSVYDVRDNHDQPVCCPGNTDPYSFIINVIMPSWPKRFRDLDFRNYVEERIRLETPAHIFPKICWVDNEQMPDFEAALYAWKAAFEQVDFNDDFYVSRLGDRSFGEYALDKLKDAVARLGEDPSLLQQASATLLKKAVEDLTRFCEEQALQGDALRDILLEIDELTKLEKLVDRSDKHNQLIETMASLRNVYPEATLYDCDDSNAENPIALNRTKLGTFKPLEDE